MNRTQAQDQTCGLNAVPVRNAKSVIREERALLEFLPGILEVQENPPSPVGRGLIWIIVGISIATVVWASIGRVDIVAVAQGKVIPTAHVKVVQAQQGGSVTAIRVQDGDHVVEGAVVLELDATVSLADERRIEEQIAYAHLEQKRLQGALSTLSSRDKQLSFRSAQFFDVDHWAVNTQAKLLKNQLDEYRARFASLEKEIGQQQHALKAADAMVRKLEAVLPLIAERSESLEQLVRVKLQGRHSWLQAEQERLECAQNLEAERHRIDEIHSTVERLQQQRIAIRANFAANLLEQMANNEKTIEQLEQELSKARQRLSWQTLRAPVAGVVQQLAVHTVGGVVTPAQQLMVIVPADSPLEIEGYILNKDVGFVRVNQEAEVKVETFPFTRYGTLPATVAHISRDAVEHEQLGLVYPTRFSLVRSDLIVDGTRIRLSPGMRVSVETKTGKRRLIDFLASPLLQYRDEGLRER